jgi:hypothetical protein
VPVTRAAGISLGCNDQRREKSPFIDRIAATSIAGAAGFMGTVSTY